MIWIPVVLLIVYILIDTYLLRLYRSKIKHVIHVNGTRGKSSLVIMLDQVFRENGYKTFSKVTGTIPMFRNVNGDFIEIKRTLATILEQKKILRKAYLDKADILIIECMALRDTMQEYSERILKADIAVITNARIDHLEIMGDRLEDIADTLFKMTNKEQWILVGDDYLRDRYHVDRADSYELIEGEHKDNTDLVFEISKKFDFDYKKTLNALSSYHKDTSFHRDYSYKGNRVLFGFAMNDLETTTDFYRKHKDDDLIIWYNNRMDRPDRNTMFLKWLLEVNPSKIVLSGDQIMLNKQKLIKHGYKNMMYSPEQIDFNNRVILGIGNIKGLEKYIGEMNV